MWTDKLKHTNPKKPKLGRVLNLCKFSDPCLCVGNCIQEYIEKTKSLRDDKSKGKLVLTYQKPHAAASKDTIARWLKILLAEAGIMNYGAHSFRSASSSAMASSGCPLDQILSSAGWTNASTFQRFYNRPVEGKVQNSNSILNYFAIASQASQCAK